LYEVQVTEKRAVEIKDKTVESIKSGDMEFQRQLRQQWAKCNEEAQKLSEHTSKLKQLHYTLAHNDALENSKKELAGVCVCERARERGAGGWGRDALENWKKVLFGERK
jgi:hypothetical protein